MENVLVIFGSKTDKKVYKQICEKLKELNVPYELKISSAHKSPREVHKILEKDYAVVIAGAGLAAHLPGVVASHVIKPVIGVPCSGNYQGLDALLSVAQMPSGVPVMGVGVDQAEKAAVAASLMLKNAQTINLVGDKENPAVKKAMALLEEFEVQFTHSDQVVEHAINIHFVYFNESVEERKELVIYCPLMFEKDDNAEAALSFLKQTTHGLWVGLNNGKNAALAAIEILNIPNTYEAKLLNYRHELQEKIKKDNEGEGHAG